MTAQIPGRLQLLLVAGALLTVAGAVVWLRWPDPEPRPIVVLQAPGGVGREPTREEVAAFEAEWDRCVASGATCALGMGELSATPGRTGWLTPVPRR